MRSEFPLIDAFGCRLLVSKSRSFVRVRSLYIYVINIGVRKCLVRLAMFQPDSELLRDVDLVQAHMILFRPISLRDRDVAQRRGSSSLKVLVVALGSESTGGFSGS